MAHRSATAAHRRPSRASLFGAALVLVVTVSCNSSDQSEGATGAGSSTTSDEAQAVGSPGGAAAAATPTATASASGKPTKPAKPTPRITRNELARKLVATAEELRGQRSGKLDPIEVANWVPKKHWSRALLKEAYEISGGTLVFIHQDNLSPAATEVIELIRSLPSHGVSTDPYPLGELDQHLAAWNKATQATAKAPSDPIEAKIAEVLKEMGPLDTAIEVEKLLESRGLDDRNLKSLGPLRASLTKRGEEASALAELAYPLDVALLQSFFRYAIDFKYLKIAHPFEALRKPERAPKVFHGELLEDFKSLVADRAPEQMRGWWPRNPLYERLRVGLAQYDKLAAEVEQPELKKSTYRLGREGDGVRQLQVRLAQEGYYGGETNGVYDEATEAASRAYQETHQMKVDGVVGGGTIRSMNVLYSSRADQIRLGLQRFRESNAREEKGHYFRVNIPEFRVQLWNDKELVRAHNVVVGSNAWDKNYAKKVQGRLNRTMLFSDEMELIVLNPKWHVPARIVKMELEPEAAENPNYYEEHNYTVEEKADGSKTVYQNSGPGNALGLVKFLFPNEHSIYLHDTPKKRLFSRPLRAFSHGCIRVENPLELAKHVLIEKDERIDEKEFKAILRTERERGLRLREKIPVHIEYNTTTVDDQGRVHFLLDVYKYDKLYRDGKAPVKWNDYDDIPEDKIPDAFKEGGAEPEPEDEGERNTLDDVLDG